ncbi:MAG: rRNA maturation RNase YbeY [Planctomycetota bacterium]
MPPAEPTTQDQPDPPGSDEPDSSPSKPPGQPQSIQVETIVKTGDRIADLGGWLKEQLHRAAVLCGLTQADLTVVVVSDEEMAKLHEQYTGIAGTTDVLTFNMLEGVSPPGSAHCITSVEGDIIVCLDEAERQAQRRVHETRHELLLYAVHGLMHLLGEDDHEEDDYERMHAREDSLLKQMGFGPLFGPDR